MNDFIPKGFISLPKAVWFISTQIHPDLWRQDVLTSREMQVWIFRVLENGDAQWLEDRLRYPFFRAKEPFPELAELRIEAYYAAERMLREALQADELRAYFLSAAPDSLGKRFHILAEGWGADAGQEILWCGRADIVGEPSSRIVFVDGYSLRQHFFPDAKLEDSSSEVLGATTAKTAEPKRRGRPAEYDWPGARQLVLQKLAYHGPPDPNDPDLPTQAVLERIAAERVTTKDRSPAASTVRDNVSRWISEFKDGARPDNEAGK